MTTIIGLVLLAVGQGAGSALSEYDQRTRRVQENARDEQIGADLSELLVLQKQLQLEIVQVQQFLTDISATRGLAGLDDGWAEAEKNAQNFQRDLERTKSLAQALGARDLGAALDEVGASFPAYYNAGKRMAQSYVTEGTGAGNAQMPAFDATSKALTANVEAAAMSLRKVQAKLDAENLLTEAALAKSQRDAAVVHVGIAVIAAVWGTILIRSLRRRVLSPLAMIADYMGVLAAGDYERPIPLPVTQDEFGRMVGSVAVFREAALERKTARLQQEEERQLAEHAKAERDAERQKADAERARVVRTLADALSSLSEGDLTARVEAQLAAEYAELKSDFNAAALKLAQTISQIRDSAGSVGVGADQISAAADDLSRRTEHQAASLEETAAALDEITAKSRWTN